MSTEYSKFTTPNPFGITHLRHGAFAVEDYEKQREFYKNVWGLTEVAKDGDVSYFAAEGSPEQYVVRLRKAKEKRMDLVAFGVDTEEHVDALAAHLGGIGVKLASTPDKLQTAGGGYGFRFFDADGHTVEMSTGVETRKHREIEERESIPVRLSHFVVNSPNIARLKKFYEDALGFIHSDSLSNPHMGGEIMHFMRVNDWHHSLAIAQGPHSSVHHISFEMRGIDEYLRGSGRVYQAGIPKIWGPGRHAAGDNTFTYFLDPSGNTHEYTTALEVITTDDRHPGVFDVSIPSNQDQWGLADPMSEIVAKPSFNDPDVLFEAPPV